MHLYIYENEKSNKTTYDAIRDFCLCERINEEFIRALIKETNCSKINSASKVQNLILKVSSYTLLLKKGYKMMLGRFSTYQKSH